MTEVEQAQLAALAKCTFSPGSTPKMFVKRLTTVDAARVLSAKETAFLDRLAHQYRRQIGRCMSVACVKCNPVIDAEQVRVALDAFLEARPVEEFDKHRALWLKVGLARYNERYRLHVAHPYEYATKVKPENRRKETLGDVYCRFCGERLFAQVKQPHRLVKASDDAQRHLTVCALQVLAGMRRPTPPGHRRLPFESLGTDGELFAVVSP